MIFIDSFAAQGCAGFAADPQFLNSSLTGCLPLNALMSAEHEASKHTVVEKSKAEEEDFTASAVSLTNDLAGQAPSFIRSHLTQYIASITNGLNVSGRRKHL